MLFLMLLCVMATASTNDEGWSMEGSLDESGLEVAPCEQEIPPTIKDSDKRGVRSRKAGPFKEPYQNLLLQVVLFVVLGGCSVLYILWPVLFVDDRPRKRKKSSLKQRMMG